MTMTELTKNIRDLSLLLDTMDITTCGLREYKTLTREFVKLNILYYKRAGDSHECHGKQHNYMRNLRKVTIK